jgi:uncharacterized protein YfiM (DUF2279 family)
VSNSKFKIWLIIIVSFNVVSLSAFPATFYPDKLIQSDSVSVESSHLIETNFKTDRWIAVDKGYHLIGSILSTTGISNSCMQFADIKKEKSIRIGAGFTFALGLSKELWDGHKKDNIFSWKDLTADVLGILIGTALLQID